MHDDSSNAPRVHVVRQGECIHSIAHAYGHRWQKVWNDSANTSLRETREGPRTLLPGDHLAIPPRVIKTEELPTHDVHKFRIHTIPVYLNLRLLDEDQQPRSGEPYVIEFSNGEIRDGTLDADGRLSEPIDPRWTRATLFVGYEPEESDGGDDSADDEMDEYGDEDLYDVIELELGGLDPIETPTGVQARLLALGYPPGRVDGDLGVYSEAALRRFQVDHGLKETGAADDDTRARLKALFERGDS